jgi:hypothetical protein
MVCFRYIIVNALHKGDDNDDNNNNNKVILIAQASNFRLQYFPYFV